MIQKKASSLQDPLNYRPISITSCLGKLLERIELEQWLIKWKMKISVEKSCSVVFSWYKKESDNLNLKIYCNRIVSQKEIKFLGIKFDSKLNFNILIDEIKERCNKRLNIIKILSDKKWGLNQNTLGNLYKSLVGSTLDYSFPCLNSFSENNIKKLQAIT
ncbi:RNA-directed DNA polymerase from mobile element jockey-like [Brachionus plicatilis]|uniref:RNA-directed DNA polymerase from mobile element jockey-like n=1 Tax=Brachionus plicatilis TaxID=10195 RepID=A0A3M7QE60_BRAPC|nr:RNA-directed DNA polymerase from mobile element jockey-like [Brachionus plicatilis]